MLLTAVAPAARLRPSAGAMNAFGAAHVAVIVGPELIWYVPLVTTPHRHVCDAESFTSGRYGDTVRQNRASGLSIAVSQVSSRCRCMLMPPVTNVPARKRAVAPKSTPWY